MTYPTLAAALEITTALASGGALGVAYFACLHETVTLFAADGGWTRPALLTAARLIAATAAFAFAARLGAGPLLAGFAGFLVARSVLLHRARSAA